MSHVDLELIVDVGFDPMEDQPVGTLNLAIGLRVIDQGLIHLDSASVVEV